MGSLITRTILSKNSKSILRLKFHNIVNITITNVVVLKIEKDLLNTVDFAILDQLAYSSNKDIIHNKNFSQ